MKPRIVILDTYYPQALTALDREHPEWRDLGYDAHLRGILDESFGTADYYSRHLRELGWDAIDIVANYATLSLKREPLPMPPPAAMDVLFLQDVSHLPLPALRSMKQDGVLLAAQISCPMPDAERVVLLDVVFTSFPHYVERLRKMGVQRVEYSPLAFDDVVLDRTRPPGPDSPLYPDHPGRDLPILFVGGVGKDIHWRQGTETLERVARVYGDRFHWYGYGREWLESDSPLHAVYRGEAWGRRMYELLLRAQIVVNRHGEVADGYANNMRLYEATGCGAMLLTDAALNLGELFELGWPLSTGEVIPYASDHHLVELLAEYLDRPDRRIAVARRGQVRTLRDHTYRKKMEQIDAVLREELAR